MGTRSSKEATALSFCGVEAQHSARTPPLHHIWRIELEAVSFQARTSGFALVLTSERLEESSLIARLSMAPHAQQRRGCVERDAVVSL